MRVLTPGVGASRESPAAVDLSVRISLRRQFPLRDSQAGFDRGTRPNTVRLDRRVPRARRIRSFEPTGGTNSIHIKHG
jgi:hypothetical protein